MSEATPYFNEDGDLWFRTSEIGYRAALSEAASWAREILGDEGRMRYIGRGPTHLCDKDLDDDDGCPLVDAWHFVMREP
jgi:hypothetical protein